MGVNQEEVVGGSRTVRAMMIEYHRPGPCSAWLKCGTGDTREARRGGWWLIIRALVGHAKDLEFIQSANLCDGIETQKYLNCFVEMVWRERLRHQDQTGDCCSHLGSFEEEGEKTWAYLGVI